MTEWHSISVEEKCLFWEASFYPGESDEQKSLRVWKMRGVPVLGNIRLRLDPKYSYSSSAERGIITMRWVNENRLHKV